MYKIQAAFAFCSLYGNLIVWLFVYALFKQAVLL